jgi:lipoic acid synthetase
MQTTEQNRPSWLKVRAPGGEKYHNIKGMLSDLKLSTVCQEAICPNIEECWNSGTATFMLMGDTCTRACRFCAVKTGNPKGWLDKDEPTNVGKAIASMYLDYVVLTSVDRDDLDDLGSDHFARTIETIKENNANIIVEVLTPDFNGKQDLIDRVVRAKPDVFAHNIETIERLTPTVRDRRSGYSQSLHTLELAKKCGQKYTKTSIMLGLGETEQEVYQSLNDLIEVGCDVVTFGQYLAPTGHHKKYLPVEEYIKPQVFKMWEDIAKSMGFLYVAAGPLVRSSYRAGEFFMKGVIEKDRHAIN